MVDTDYKTCLYELMAGLEIQYINAFIMHGKPEDYRKLGHIYADEVKRFIREHGWMEPFDEKITNQILEK